MIQLRINNLEIQREKDLQFERVKLELKDTKLQLQKAVNFLLYSSVLTTKNSSLKFANLKPPNPNIEILNLLRIIS